MMRRGRRLRTARASATGGGSPQSFARSAAGESGSAHFRLLRPVAVVLPLQRKGFAKKRNRSVVADVDRADRATREISQFYVVEPFSHVTVGQSPSTGLLVTDK